MCTYVECQIPQLDTAISTRRRQLILVDLRPREVVQAILCIETEAIQCARQSYERSNGADAARHLAHPFSTTTPAGCCPSTLSRPLPTSPKLAEPAAASLLGKNGEKATEYAAKLSGSAYELPRDFSDPPFQSLPFCPAPPHGSRRYRLHVRASPRTSASHGPGGIRSVLLWCKEVRSMIMQTSPAFPVAGRSN